MAKTALVWGFTSDASMIREMAKSLTSRGKKWDEDAHIALVSALMHYGEHHDWTPMIAVLDAFPRSARKLAAVAWIEAFASLKYKKKDNTFNQPKDAAKRFAKVEEGKAIHFGDFTQEKDPQQITLDVLIHMVQGKVAKMYEQGNLSEDDAAGLDQKMHDAVVAGISKAAMPA